MHAKRPRRRVRRILLLLLGTLALAIVVLNWTYGRLPAEPKPTGAFMQVGTLRIHYIERPGTGTPDAAAAGKHPNALQGVQAHLIQFLQLPVIRQIADATFSQLLLTAAGEMGDSEAFAPEPVDSAHEHRLLAINMTHGNLEALAGEYEAAGGVVRRIDKRLKSIEAPAIVIQGSKDHLVEPIYGRRLAADLPHARLEMLYGSHMQPYVHPTAIAAAVKSLQAAGVR